MSSKTLLIMRHGKADGQIGGRKDIERPLTDLGRKRTAVVANELVKKKVLPQFIISSPAARAPAAPRPRRSGQQDADPERQNTQRHNKAAVTEELPYRLSPRAGDSRLRRKAQQCQKRYHTKHDQQYCHNLASAGRQVIQPFPHLAGQSPPARTGVLPGTS